MGVMKRLAAAVVIAFGVWAVSAGAAAPRATLRYYVCQRALDPAARAVSVQAVMRPLPGTKKLSLRFQLLRRRPMRSATLVRAGDLGAWITPNDPTLGQRPGDVWQFNKAVVNLVVAPASYHFRVTFRWTGAHGRVLGTAVRLSSSCFQPELRPDLLVHSIAVLAVAGKPHLDRYIALIRNGGATAVGRFEVVFDAAQGSSTLQLQTIWVPRLGPHKGVHESFVGPLCTAGSTPTITVDPGGLIDDYNRSNNSLVATCPAPGVS